MPNNECCRDVIIDSIDLFNQVITLEVYRYDASVLKKINKIWLTVLKTQKFIFSLLKKSAFIISAGDSKGHNDSRSKCVKRRFDKYFWFDDQFNSSF